MKLNLNQIVDKLIKEHSLELEEYEFLIKNRTTEITEKLAAEAVKIRTAIYGKSVFIRGLIEVSNICKNDCYYCGIRRSNKNCERYRLSKEESLECVDEGYELGFRTFVMQGGEDAFFTDNIVCDIVSEIKNRYPDCAVTLSLGERSYDSYKRLFDAGADRYLLRHETADTVHYEKLHPAELTLEHRMECLNNLREIGYQVGCGFMVGSPYQTYAAIAKDLKFIEYFKPDMCGIGPFIPHKDTPLRDCTAGTTEKTIILLAITRLLLPKVLLPATTALASIDTNGRTEGLRAGANVIMPNLSPMGVRKKYSLYNNKAFILDEDAEYRRGIEEKLKEAGFELVVSRGDNPDFV